jgi:selenocysteine lyase/cysteine desulfurase
LRDIHDLSLLVFELLAAATRLLTVSGRSAGGPAIESGPSDGGRFKTMNRGETFMLDIDFVRGQFPAFAQESLQGQAFFENAGGSYTCQPVIDRLTRFYTERKVQPYAPYQASRLGGEEMDEARRRLAAMMGVETDELSFGPSTTQNTYVLANAFRQFMQPGDAIVVTNQDHEANTGPWRRLADEGFEVREWQVDP